MELNVRKAQLEDAEAIAKIQVQTWLETYKGMIPDQVLKQKTDLDYKIERWKTILSDPDNLATAYVIEDESNKILAFASIGPSREKDANNNEGELWSMYLDHNYYRQGIGTILMQEMLAQLSESGYTMAILWVASKNKRARSFYEKIGWQSTGESKVEDGIDEIKYLIDL